MTSLKLTDIKTFMQQLLRTEIFDNFLLSEATIIKDAAFTIDGHFNREFYTTEELEELHLMDAKILPYSMLRPSCFELIKGRHTPVYFKFILMLSPENMAHTLSCSESGLTSKDVNSMLINIVFQNGQLTLTTGISYTTFSLEHTLDKEWDSMMQKFLYKHGVSYEEL